MARSMPVADPQALKNLTVELEDGELALTVDMTKKPTASASGKSMLFASSGGVQDLGNILGKKYAGVMLVCTIYTSKGAGAKGVAAKKAKASSSQKSGKAAPKTKQAVRKSPPVRKEEEKSKTKASKKSGIDWL